MTSPRAHDSEEHLFSLLARGARRASDTQLASAVILGLAGVVLLLARPTATWWKWMFPFTCLAAFGAWGITDRLAQERLARSGHSSAGQAALTAARWLALGVGVLAAAITGFLALGLALGLMKS